MREFPPLTPEEEVIIIEALKFTKEKIKEYHSNWLSDSSKVNHADINRRQAKYEKILNNVLDLVQKPELQNQLFRDSDLHNINEYIASSLNIYAKEYEKAQDPNLPSSRYKLFEIQHLLNGARFGHILSNLWNEFYEGYQSEMIKKGKLIFFSYSSKERKIVGEIIDRLKSRYGYEVFRAHDKESIDNDEDWRNKIKENLENCDGLIAYVTRNFRYSPWTLQECGWVMARERPIYSILVMKKIPGLLESKQGTKVTLPINYDELVEDINNFFNRYYARAQ